jgi:uncharacterized protein
LVTFGGSTAFEDTLDQALNKVFGAASTKPPEDDGTTTTPPPTSTNPTVQQALDDAQKAFTAGQEALKKGDWVAYGKAQKDLEAALKRAEDAQAEAGKGNKPGSSPSPSSSPSSGSSPGSGAGGSPSPKPSSSPSG